jgi:hypothetical protein
MERISIHSGLIATSLSQIDIIPSLWPMIYSLFPLLSLLNGITPPMVTCSFPLVQPLPSFWLYGFLFEALPREMGKPKCGLDYYH